MIVEIYGIKCFTLGFIISGFFFMKFFRVTKPKTFQIVSFKGVKNGKNTLMGVISIRLFVQNTTAVNQNSGGAEARMKNANVYYVIRVS